MRFYTFAHENKFRLGVEWKTQLLDFAICYRILVERKPPATPNSLKKLPSDLLKFLELGTPAFEAVREALLFAAKRPAVSVDERLTYSFEEVQLCAPISRPGKIICASSSPSTWFAKMPSTLIGTGDSIVHPQGIKQLGCEPRLGLVIGKKCRAAAETEVMRYVAGFIMLNDISSQDSDLPDENFIGRNFDTFCPLGPCFVSVDELLALIDQAWRVSVNGKIIDNGSIAEVIAAAPNLLSQLSRIMTLEPGDLVGVALSTPAAIRVKCGDSLVTELNGFGKLENRVIEVGSGA